jgi:uncharacterized membrane protein
MLSLGGIVVSVVGVLMLFFFGMPYRLQAEGQYIITESLPEEEARLNRVYRFLGFVGLALVLTGAAMQACGVLASDPLLNFLK